VGLTPAEAEGRERELPASGPAHLLSAAAALRWSRPDLTAELADHVLAGSAAFGDRERWLVAAGWAVHARSATGDGRETASNMLKALRRWGSVALAMPAADRLRVELALVAVGVGQTDRARALLAPIATSGGSPQLRADAYTALARCALEDAPGEVTAALRAARAGWAEVGGSDAQTGMAAADLVAAAAHRRGGRPGAAAEAARAGISRLEGVPELRATGTPSEYLSAALTAEWISALLDEERFDEARHGCEPLLAWLAEPVRPSRQLARLRLMTARALAPGGASRLTAQLLEKAAQDAAASDAPDLEFVSRSALATVLEGVDQIEAATRSTRAAELARRRDRHRDRQFHAMLAVAVPEGPAVRVPDVVATVTLNDHESESSAGRNPPALRLLSRRGPIAGTDAIAANGLIQRPVREAHQEGEPGRDGAGRHPGSAQPDADAALRTQEVLVNRRNRRRAEPDGEVDHHENGGGSGHDDGTSDVGDAQMAAESAPVAQWPWVDTVVTGEDDGPTGPEVSAGDERASFGGPAAEVVRSAASSGPGIVSIDREPGNGETADQRAARTPGLGIPGSKEPLPGDPLSDDPLAGSTWLPSPAPGDPVRGVAADSHPLDGLWLDESGESPIGDLLMQNLRAGRRGERDDDAGGAHRAPIGQHSAGGAGSVALTGGEPGPPDRILPDRGLATCASGTRGSRTCDAAEHGPADRVGSETAGGRESADKGLADATSSAVDLTNSATDTCSSAVDLSSSAVDVSSPPIEASDSATDAGNEAKEAGNEAKEAGSEAKEASSPPVGVCSPATEAGSLVTDTSSSATRAGGSVTEAGSPATDTSSSATEPGSAGAQRADNPWTSGQWGGGAMPRTRSRSRFGMCGSAPSDAQRPEVGSAQAEGSAAVPPVAVPPVAVPPLAVPPVAGDSSSGNSSSGNSSSGNSSSGDSSSGGLSTAGLSCGSSSSTTSAPAVPGEGVVSEWPVDVAGSTTDRVTVAAGEGTAATGPHEIDPPSADLSEVAAAAVRVEPRSVAVGSGAARSPGNPARAERSARAPRSSDQQEKLRAALADLDRAWGAAAGGGASSAVEHAPPDRIESGWTSGPSSPTTAMIDTARIDTARIDTARIDTARIEAATIQAATSDGLASDADTGIFGDRGARGAVEHGELPAGIGHLIVIDVARDGRRFAGRRADAILQTVAERLLDLLPAGSHLHPGSHDALVLLLPDTDGAAVASWMHHALTGVVDDVVVEADLARLQLRSVVTGPGGPVGAELLQRLDRARSDWTGAGQRSEQVGEQVDDHARTGRHDATGRVPYRGQGADVGPGHGGRRHRAEAEQPARGDASPSPGLDPTEGLGLADLLAGALAAYRGI
jgi:hypothetical protein